MNRSSIFLTLFYMSPRTFVSAHADSLYSWLFVCIFCVKSIGSLGSLVPNDVTLFIIRIYNRLYWTKVKLVRLYIIVFANRRVNN
jgi:hypothetical protein